MAALVAASVTATITERRIVGKKRRNVVTLTFGDAALTYPTGGVPMPAASAFGMTRQLDFLNVLDQSATGFFWKYDIANNKLWCYTEQAVALNAPLLEASVALAPVAQTIKVEAVGW